ncbi:MAG TPA: helix-turn-helix domain-containing protein, partial [Candidatus Dormibacteraeota bacterium]|nr:helix-turn-helix domain-containing protein [Candidatus Dormibacteraeota bacterium]
MDANTRAADAVTEASATTPHRSPRSDAVRNRERLLDAAMAAFAARGVEVPLEEIARSAGVGIGTLYRHFPTRDALIEAAYRHEVGVLAQAATDLLAAMPADEALGRWMQLFVGHVALKRGMASALRSMIGPENRLFEDSRALILAAASDLLAAAVASGTVRSDVQARDLVQAIGGVCMSVDQA